jgi:UDP-N-acetylmuramate: L-alanyl-gamma-D-glutamyl-meso-diaminopimelate ligase
LLRTRRRLLWPITAPAWNEDGSPALAVGEPSILDNLATAEGAAFDFPASLRYERNALMFTQLKRLHFLGICGTAMGAVAAALRDQGYVVTGSDEDIYPPMSTFLEQKGIALRKGYRPENLPADAELIVIGNAIRRGNPEVEEVLNRKLPYTSLPEILKFFFLGGRHNLVVTGTHGKTTTTALLAWILESAGLAPGYVIGGLPNNLPQGAQLRPSGHYVIEGDEYDTAFFDKRSKFVHYLPELLIINNIEFDHADIYKNIDEIKLSFRRLVNIVPSNGLILYNSDDAHCVDVVGAAFARKLAIGIGGDAQAGAGRIAAIDYRAGQSHFEFQGEAFTLPLSGEFNVRNACMAIAAARECGVSFKAVREALAAFTGVRRRQEVRGEVNGIKVMDDFGHHPTAIRQTLRGLRQQHGSAGRIWALFEPRSNSTRRAVFQDQLASAFEDADGVVMARVAKIEQIPEGERLDPERVVAAIRASGKEAFYEDGTPAIIARAQSVARAGDLIVVFSNGGFDGIHAKLLAELA